VALAVETNPITPSITSPTGKKLPDINAFMKPTVVEITVA
jgi:hypothetical protein